MAHFADVDKNNIVTRVLVVPDEQEHRGAEYLASDLHIPGNWIQTSITGRIRKNFAQPGGTYDPIRDAFIYIKPYPSWVLDEETAQWVPPTDSPGEGYVWSEDALDWICTVCTDQK